MFVNSDLTDLLKLLDVNHARYLMSGLSEKDFAEEQLFPFINCKHIGLCPRIQIAQ